MDKLAKLQQQLQDAEDKKVALQDQVRTSRNEPTMHAIGVSNEHKKEGRCAIARGMV